MTSDRRVLQRADRRHWSAQNLWLVEHRRAELDEVLGAKAGSARYHDTSVVESGGYCVPASSAHGAGRYELARAGIEDLGRRQGGVEVGLIAAS